MTAEIELFLRELRGETVQFYPMPGNGGDCLITTGTYHVFDRVGLKYELIDMDTPPEASRGRVVLFGGGGNLVPYYTQLRRMIEPRHALATRVVILPHTIGAHPELIAALGANADVIVREAMSFAFVDGCRGAARLHLMDDLAFNMDVERVLTGRPPFRLPTAKEAARHFLYYLRPLRGLPPSPDDGVYRCFRVDEERTGPPPPGNVDLPMRLTPRTSWPYATHVCVRSIFRIFQASAEIHTNRLHMGVAGALLGKPTYLHDNNYGKVGAVYRQSIEGRFPNVTWRGSTPPAGDAA